MGGCRVPNRHEVNEDPRAPVYDAVWIEPHDEPRAHSWGYDQPSWSPPRALLLNGGRRRPELT